MDDDLFERLLSTLAMVVGREGLIVLGDLGGLDPQQQTEVPTWTARALITAALEEPERRDSDQSL